MVHVVVVVCLTEKEADNGGLGSTFGLSCVLENGRLGQGILLEGEEALRMALVKIPPPRRDNPGAGSGFDEVFGDLRGFERRREGAKGERCRWSGVCIQFLWSTPGGTPVWITPRSTPVLEYSALYRLD